MLGHFHKVTAEKIFFSKDVDAGKMADFLVIVEAEEILGLKVTIDPHDVPILGFFGCFDGPSEFLGSDFDDFILSFGDVDDDLIFGDVFHAVFDELREIGGFIFGGGSIFVVAVLIIAIGHVIFIT